MNELLQIPNAICEYILTPASLIGALGGVFKSFTKHSTIRQSLTDIFCGAVVAQLCSPYIIAHAPQDIQPIGIFLCGYGGIELVNWVYTLAKEFIERKSNKGIKNE